MLRSSRLLRGLFVLGCAALAGCATSPESSNDPVDSRFRSEIEQGRSFGMTGQPHKAIEVFDSVIDTIDEEGLEEEHFRDLGYALSMRGIAHRDVGNLQGSVEDFRRSIAVHEKHVDENTVRQRDLYVELGRSLGLAQSYGEANQAFRRALELSERVEGERNPLVRANIYSLLAYGTWLAGDVDQAVVEYTNSIDEALSAGNENRVRAFVGDRYLDLANMLRVEERYDAAVHPISEAIRYLEGEGHRPEPTATAYYFQGLIFSALGNPGRARPSYIRSVELFDISDQPNWDFVGVASYNAALSFLDTGEQEKALFYFEKAADAYERLLAIYEQRARQGLPGPSPAGIQNLRMRLADAERHAAELRRRAETADSIQLNKYELSLSPDSLPSDVEVERVSVFSAVSLMNSLLDALDLNQHLGPQAKYSIADALFRLIPNSSDGLYREARIGGYFDDGGPLVIRTTAITPGPGATTSAERVIVLQTNVQVADGALQKGTGQFGAMEENLTHILLLFGNGLLVRETHLRSAAAEAVVARSNEVPPHVVVNAADTILKDEIRGNDASVAPVLQRMWNELPEQDMVRVTAGLNLILYYLAIEEPDRATRLLGELTAVSKVVENPSLQRVVEHEAADMIEVYRRFAARRTDL